MTRSRWEGRLGSATLVRVAWLAAALAVTAVSGAAQSGIRNTKHNLSASSLNTVRATSEGELCVFCHVPHQGRTDAPLWNRGSSVAAYTPYTSSSLQGATGQPNGSSKLCLSCHDGTIALGTVLVTPSTGLPGTFAMTGAGTGGVMPAGRSLLGTNLSSDHPVSFVFDATVRTNDGELVDPTTLAATPLKLWQGATPGVRNTVQCSTCHDAHTDALPKFLLRSARGRTTNICLTCHTKPGWAASTHEASSASVAIDGITTTVSDHACMSCHTPHADPGAQRLLRAGATAGVSTIETTCYQCHKAASVGQNIQGEIAKTSKHPVASAAYAGRHNPVFITQPPTGLPENVLLRPGVAAPDPRFTDQQHVECVDCHNPHRTTKASMLEGMRGISLAGVILTNVRNDSSVAGASQQYAVCFRCHGDSYATTLPNPLASGLTARNKRIEFQVTNSSQHAVGGVGRNSSANLNAQLTPRGLSVNSVVRCTDCHNSNAYALTAGKVVRVAGSPSGPHGSTNSSLLRANYRRTFNLTTYTANNFALCYVCHQEAALLGSVNTATSNFNDGNNLHFEHVRNWVSSAGTLCISCHYNSHSNVESTTTQYNINGTTYTTPPAGTPTRMVNFSPNTRGSGGRARPEWWFNSTTKERRCYVVCHTSTGGTGGKDHTGYSYRPTSGDLP